MQNESSGNGKEKREVRISVVPSNDIYKYWDTICEGLIKALENSGREFTVETLYNNLVTGANWLWIVLSGHEYAGVMITEVIKTDSNTWLNIPFAYSVSPGNGSGRSYGITEAALKEIEETAKSLGCDGVKFISSRKGFERVAPNSGYKMRCVEYVKRF